MTIVNTQAERAWQKFWAEFTQYYGILLNYADFLTNTANTVDLRSVRTFWGQLGGLLARTNKLLADHGTWIEANHPAEYTKMQDFLTPATEIRDTVKSRLDAALGSLDVTTLLNMTWYETQAVPTLTQTQRDALATYIRDRLA